MRAHLFTALFVLLAVATPTNAQKRTLAEARKWLKTSFWLTTTKLQSAYCASTTKADAIC